jgi:hypothetical protein
MKIPQDGHVRMKSAFDLLSTPSISFSTFEQVRALIKGLHPEIDRKLEICSKALANVQKIQTGDIISLTAENLPEENEEQKKRKKFLLFFINSVKDLKNEIKRVQNEFSKGNSSQNQVKQWGGIIKYAKGPFGIITAIAIGIVIFLTAIHGKTENMKLKTANLTPPLKNQIQVITYNGKQIPLSQLYVGHGPDCDSPHYHATNGQVVTLDNIVVKDPEGCGFGRIKDVKVTIVEE